MNITKEQMLDALSDAVTGRMMSREMADAIAALIESGVPAVEYKLRPEVGAFAALMEAELRKHDDRPGWKKEDVQWLFGRLKDESVELITAIAKHEPEAIAKEAADVANFAMMIADVATFATMIAGVSGRLKSGVPAEGKALDILILDDEHAIDLSAPSPVLLPKKVEEAMERVKVWYYHYNPEKLLGRLGGYAKQDADALAVIKAALKEK